MRLLFVELCVSTGVAAVNRASVDHALMGLRIQEGTQTLSEILTSVMSTGEQVQGDPGVGWEGESIQASSLPPSQGHLGSSTPNIIS